MSTLADRLTFKRELPQYLHELSLLVDRPVQETELLSLEQTRKLRAQANQVTRQPVVKFQIPFEEKKDDKFRAFLKRLAAANSCDVYFWTPRSNLCGVLQPLPLDALHIEFPFDLNPEGIVVILTSNLGDQLLLDYSLGEQGEQLLEVEASGEHWGDVAY